MVYTEKKTEFVDIIFMNEWMNVVVVDSDKMIENVISIERKKQKKKHSTHISIEKKMNNQGMLIIDWQQGRTMFEKNVSNRRKKMFVFSLFSIQSSSPSSKIISKGHLYGGYNVCSMIW